MTVICTRYVPINKNACIGIATLYVPKWGIEIHNCSLNEKDGSRWISLPSKPYESDGKKKYASHITFKEKSVYEKFIEVAKQAIDLKIQELDEATKKNADLLEDVPF